MSKESEMSFKGRFVKGLFSTVLPELAEEYPDVARALEPREGVSMNDVELGFWATPELPDDIGGVVDRLGLALDIVLRNQGLNFERRKQILIEYRKLVDDY